MLIWVFNSIAATISQRWLKTCWAKYTLRWEQSEKCTFRSRIRGEIQRDPILGELQPRDRDPHGEPAQTEILSGAADQERGDRQVSCAIQIECKVRCASQIECKVRCAIQIEYKVRCAIQIECKVRCAIQIECKAHCAIQIECKARCAIQIECKARCAIQIECKARSAIQIECKARCAI